MGPLDQRTRLVSGTLLAIIVAVGLSMTVTYGFPATSQVSTQGGAGRISDCGFVTVCEASNPSGLLLTLSINATSVRSDGELEFTISVVNPTLKDINMTPSENWYLHSLAWPCNNGDLIPYGGIIPYGIAAFKGYFDLGNVTSADDILQFPPIGCVSMHNVTSFSVPPKSTFQPAYWLDFSLLRAINASSTTSGSVIEPVTYTLAVGDEWGDLVLLHFSVSHGGPLS